MAYSLGNLGIVCDFDGTITTRDVAVTLLTTFARGRWRHWDRQLEAGRIRVMACLQRQFAAVRASRRTLIDYALAQVLVRPGFSDFVDFCRDQRMPLVVASAGLDFYIRAILERAGVGVPELVCARARFTRHGIRVSYAHLRGKEATGRLDLKERAVERLRRAGRTVVYVGDGLPDLPAARRSDLVFARARLAGACRDHGIAYRPFGDFYDIMAALADAQA